MTLWEKLTSDGPKRILALDGGGIRGILALLGEKAAEQQVQDEHLPKAFDLSV